MRDLLRRVGIAAFSALGFLATCTDFRADRRVLSSAVLAVGPGTVTVRVLGVRWDSGKRFASL